MGGFWEMVEAAIASATTIDSIILSRTITEVFFIGLHTTAVYRIKAQYLKQQVDARYHGNIVVGTQLCVTMMY